MQQRSPDRRSLTEQLLHLEGRIAMCRKHIAQQHAAISAQVEEGTDPAPARRLLGEITNLLAMQLIERDRLRRELDELLE